MKLTKSILVFSEVAENWLAIIDVAKSVPIVSFLCINRCWEYSPHEAYDTCAKLVQGGNPHLHEISIKPFQIWRLPKIADADDEISAPSHPTHAQHVRSGENDF